MSKPLACIIDQEFVEPMLDGEADEELQRKAAYLLTALKIFVREADPEAIHKAFGAPGNWGYGTPIGDELLKIYQGKS
jgi:hypothetical protein